MLVGEVEAEALVQALDDPGQGFQLFAAGAFFCLASGRLEWPDMPFECDSAAARSLDAEGLHVDVLLYLKGQCLSADGQKAAEVPGELVELL